MQKVVFVTEFTSFNEAWSAATSTVEMFNAFQGMENKIKYIMQANRWFVDMAAKELYYSYLTNDGIRIVDKAHVHSMLSDSAFQYIQIMVSPLIMQGNLRFSGQYVNRANAIKCSKESEVFAFNK